jgi:hypothetical protein
MGLLVAAVSKDPGSRATGGDLENQTLAVEVVARAFLLAIDCRIG